MKKILFLSYYFPPDWSAGSVRSQALISKWSSQYSDIKVDVLTTSPNRYSSFSSDTELKKDFGLISIKRFKVPLKSSNFFTQAISFFFFTIFCLKEAKKEKYDLIFATSSRLMTAFLGAVIASRQEVKLYLDIRDIFRDTFNDVFNNLLNFFLNPILLFIEKFTYNKAIKINLVSPGFEDYFRNEFNQKKLSFFTNGIDSDFLKGDNFYQQNKFDVLQLHVVYAGNIGDGQSLHKLIPQFAFKSPNLFFTIIGDGSKKNELINEISNLGLKNVKLIKPISRSELLKYYQKADILLLNLDSIEAFKKVLPSKIFEYAATTKPILAGVSGYAKTFFEENIENLLCFKPSCAQDAHKKMSNLELKFIKREIFCEEYSRDNIISKLANDVTKYI